MNNPLAALSKYGQSVWLDNINRSMIIKNELKKLIDAGEIKGLTSNPTIFQKAIGAGHDYDEQIKELLTANPSLSAGELFEALAVKDIQDAADLLFPVYKESNGVDGFCSIEVSPELAYDTEKTIEEARRLNKRVNRPNLMVKIPATAEGIPAIRQMISEGVCINVTLIFSPASYESVVDAYMSGLENRLAKGESIAHISSVASFFISRIDSAVDKELDKAGYPDLKGKIAIANAKLTYKRSKELFGSDRFKKLEKNGAKVQRLLWASTSTKNPAYPDTLYVEELIGRNTINTMPPQTIEAYRDHGNPEHRIETGLDIALMQMQRLSEKKIDFEAITKKLTEDGVVLFADSFRDLMKTIEEKKKTLVNNNDQKIHLPSDLERSVSELISVWEKDFIVKRVWQKDPSVWKSKREEDVELSNRLGWLSLASDMKKEAAALSSFAEEMSSNFDHVVLLGMGGSSLAPEVFYKTFGNRKGYPQLIVSDSTHPVAVKRLINTLDLNRSLFIAASKSGGTVETMSFFYIFYNELAKIKSNPGENFIAITDQGTSLEKLAHEKKFRKVFTTPAEVGGRYSALTFFGLVPAALIGVDISKILQRSEEMAALCSREISGNPGFTLGAVLGELALKGKDKVTFYSSEEISSFPAWVEQLIAESTGKEGKGILPVADEKLNILDNYSTDRVFVFLMLNGSDNSPLNKKSAQLKAAGHPVIEINLNDKYDLGKEFFRWETATAAAGAALKINPFDQPNVQLAKTLASEAINKYKETGKLLTDEPVLSENNISVYGFKQNNLKDTIHSFLAQAKSTDYAAIMAFIPPSEETSDALKYLASKIIVNTKLPCTVGYGPRFLHSTGQLHKGDGNNGLFIQITSAIKGDIEVPGQGYTFGTLVTAQARGDFKALQNTGRRVIRLHIDGDLTKVIKTIAELI